MSHLVLLSGWGVDARIWQALEGCWPAELSVSAPDWPGYGTRAALDAPGDLDGLADAMADSLPVDAVWVGWSLGGLLAAALLERLPAPRGLVMLGMRQRFTDEAGRGGVTARELAAFRQAFSRDPQRTWQHFLRLQLSGEPSPRRASQRLNTLLGNTRPADDATLTEGLNQLATLDMRQVLQHAPCPAHIVRGAQDPLLPEPAEQEEPIMLAGSGHCPQLSVPLVLARCLSELARNPGHLPASQREASDAR